MLAAQSYYRLGGFVLVMVLARRLPAAEIGVFVFAMAFADSFVAISSFGMNPVMSRRVAADNATAARHFSAILGVRAVSGILYLVVVMTAALVFTSAGWQIMLAATVIALVEDTYYSFGSLFLALRKAVYNVTVGVTVQTIFILLFLVGMKLHPTLWTLVAVNAVRVVALLAAAILVTHSRLFKLRFSWDSTAVRIAVPFVMMAVVTSLRDQIGAVVLGFLANYDAVAHFNLVMRVSAASLAIPTAVCAVLSPLVVASGLDARNRQRIAMSAFFIFGVAVLGSIVTATMYEPLARILYGPLAPQTAPLLRLLAIMFPISFMALFCALVLQALFREVHVLRTMILVAATNLLGNLLLIPRLGAKGAIYAQILATMLQLLILAWDLRRMLFAERHAVV
jgi:O-antigen/teichoic acid export membrane protein